MDAAKRWMCKLASLLGLLIVVQACPVAGQDKPFVPHETNSWAFQADDDVDAESPIDLRGLNEKRAGEHGFVRLSEDRRGFLRAAGEVKLADVVVDSKNEHVGVAVVALDDRPLATSGKVLVQTTPRARPTGWEVQQAEHKDNKSGKTVQGWRIVSTGKLPFRMETITGRVTIRNASLTKATVLDEMGRPRPGRDVNLARREGSVELTLPRDAVWVILE